MLTSIQVAEILDIRYEINNYLGAKDWQLAVVYTLYLRKVYPFGDEIHLSYTLSKEIIEKGPEFIQYIKKLIEIDT